MTLFYGKSIDMKFVPSNQKAWLDYLEKNSGKKLIVEVELEKSKRSLDQNSYLWGVVYKTIAIETGHTENKIHQLMKRICLPPKFIKVMGKELKVPASTTDLNKAEFGEYIEKIRAEVSSLGIVIPEANNKKEFDIKSIYPENTLGKSKF